MMLPINIFFWTACVYYKLVDFVNPSWMRTPEHVGRVSSVFCSLQILAFLYFDGTLASTYCFLSYLIIDTFFRGRRNALNYDGYAHHFIGITLGCGGVYLLSNFPENDLYANVINTLLKMEITTPVLHAAWLFKEQHEHAMSTLMFISLLILWIPLRIIEPTKMLMSYYYSGIFISWINILMFFTIFFLILMQLYWLKLLCVVGMKNVCKWQHIK